MSLLGAILLVTAATELWSPLVPQYLKALQQSVLQGDVSLLITIGLYGFYRDGLEALNYFAGGAIAGRFNSRRALLFFNFLPLVGLIILFAWKSTAAVFLAIPFIFVWDSIAGPATITVVGDSLDPARRTMAFSMQSIFKRTSRIVAYLISAPLVAWLGRVNGLRADVAIAVGLILLALVIQTRFMRTASRDESVVIHRPLQLLRSFPTDLKRLLAADILSRWAEGLAGPFVILYCVPILSGDANHGTALYQSVLLTIQAVTNIVLYIVVGPLASREGLAKKPFIGWTFVFFAAFPISLILLGPSFGIVGLAMAFVIGGFREIGEPARKAMIADLVPREVGTQAVGLYWSARGVCVMWAAPVGALCWIAGDRVHPGAGPGVAFSVAGILGLVGAVLFALRFGHAAPARP